MCRRSGDGPPALLIHGTAGATHSWRGLAPLLARDFRIVAPDLPGHGFTRRDAAAISSLPGMAQALAALMAKLECAPQLVVGHSAGAAILARLVADGRIAPDLFVAINGAFLPFRGLRRGLFPAVARLLLVNPFAARLFAWSADRDAVAKCSPAWARKLDARGLDLYARLMRNPAHCAGALDMMANWDLSRTARRSGAPRLSRAARGRRQRQGDRPAAADKVARPLSRARIESCRAPAILRTRSSRTRWRRSSLPPRARLACVRP